MARVALELSEGAVPTPLLPTFWGNDYLNKPPGLHWLIAALLSLLRPEASEVGAAATAGLPLPPPAWMVRLIPALLSTFIVPIGALIQSELRPGRRLPAVATGAVLLCLLPVVRHGRLAMLDGTQLTLIGFLYWCLLRRISLGADGRWPFALLAGLAGSGLLLLKAPMLLPVLVIGFVGLAIDPRKPFRSGLLGPDLLLLVVGLLPGLAWHVWSGWNRGDEALWLWWGDGAGRVLLQSGEGSDLGWRVPVIEILEGGWPWLVLWPSGVLLAWRERHGAAGRWTLVLQFGLAAVILPLRTQLPWYGHPLWLPFALLIGPVLAWMIDQRPIGVLPQPLAISRPPGAVLLRRVPLLWSLLGVLLFTGWLLSLMPQGPAMSLAPIRGVLLMAGLGWTAGGLLLAAQTLRLRRLGGTLMMAGTALALLVLMASPWWLWELNETWSVTPVAALTRRWQARPVALWKEPERPSLSWYAGQRIHSVSRGEALATDDSGWSWILRRGAKGPGGLPCQRIDASQGLTLWRCRPSREPKDGLVAKGGPRNTGLVSTTW